MCAKVTMPLLSGSASGKIADAMVYFPWKGLSVVRQFLIPVNKMSGAQGNQRTMLGGIGRAAGKIRPNPASAIVSKFAQQLITLNLIATGQTKQSHLVSYVLDHYLTDATAYATQLGLFMSHVCSVAFGDQADILGITEMSLPYDTIAAFQKGFGLYLLGKYACDVPFTGTPYTLAIDSWVTASISAMISDFTTAA